MKAHQRIILGILVLVISVFAISLVLPPVSTAKVHTSFASIAVSTVSPTATPPSLTDQINNVISPIQAFFNLVATFLVIVLAGFIILRSRIFNPPSNLVVETFKNSTGIADLDKVLLGLTQRTREILVYEIDGVRAQTENYKNLSPNPDQLPPKSPIPAEDVDQQLSTLLKSLQDVASGEVKTAVQLLGLISPPRGTKVTTTLHLLGEPNMQPGMSLEITDLQDKLPPRLYTIQKSSVEQTKPNDSLVQKLVSLEHKLLADVEHKESPKKDKPVADTPAEKMPDLQALEGYYIKLKYPVARWLAIELAQQSWTANEPKRDRIFYQAKLYNFIASLHLASAIDQSFSDYPFFYELAIQNFNNAIRDKETKDWYQPYENLGDTYSTWGQYVQDKNSIDRQQRALLFYDQALNHLNTPIAHLSEETPAVRNKIGRRIRVEKVTTQLHIGIQTSNQGLIQQASIDTHRIAQEVDAFSETDSQIQYDLASCFALLNERSNARRYLTYSLARDPNQLREAKYDPDLKNITDGLETLYDILTQTQINPTLTGEPYEKAINKVLSEANWLT